MSPALAGGGLIKSRGGVACTANNDESNAMKLVLCVVNARSAGGKSSSTLSLG